MEARFIGVAKRALAKRVRWDDPPYLTRIIFDELTKGEQGEETGAGITTSLTDNEHTIIGINPLTKEVSFETDSGTIKGKMSFEDFVTRQDKWSQETNES